jgi:uncharacterized protein (DUF3084 family)
MSCLLLLHLHCRTCCWLKAKELGERDSNLACHAAELRTQESKLQEQQELAQQLLQELDCRVADVEEKEAELQARLAVADQREQQLQQQEAMLKAQAVQLEQVEADVQVCSAWGGIATCRSAACAI